MKNLFLIAGIVVISCCSAKKTIENGNNNKRIDSSLLINKKENNIEQDAELPGCIKKLVSQFKQEEKQNPPRRIYSYTYKGKLVYYVPAICCDFFSDLYDNKCDLIAHPDGGFTGKGDERAPDFIQKKTNEKLIWKDDRK